MTEEKLGPTGKFPEGKISDDDEGELQFAVGVTQGGDVFMDFGKPVHWVAFPPESSLDLAEMLRLNARKAIKVQEVSRQLASQKGGVGDSGS